MKATPLATDNPSVHLVEPDLERDALLGVQWFQGEDGRNTLQLMGVADHDNQSTTLEQERQRVAGFIEKTDQLNWMIAYDGRIVGSIWVDVAPKDSVPSPAIHIMVGDPTARGQGVGTAAISRVIEYLEKQGNKSIYSRHVTKNTSIKNLLYTLGFRDLGASYRDATGLTWQNVVRHHTRSMLRHPQRIDQ